MSGNASSADVPQPGDPNYLPQVTITDDGTGGGDDNTALTAVTTGSKIAGLAAAGAVLGPVGSVVGGLIGLVGSIFGSNQQAEIDRRKAALDEAEAKEVERRATINDAITQTTGFRAQADISAEMAGSGHEGAAIGTQLEVRRQANLKIRLDDQAAAFQASQLRAGAQLQNELADQTVSAGVIKGIGYGVTAIGSAGRQIVNDSRLMSSKPLPSYGGGF